ncbi:hypothetical protein ABIE78_001595 [Sinorhizobium fredii]|uniref:Uncharacterized protein n=1 Tax=Sinorhizobium fredii (strain USDA 257) TaxID=1185652 RepID=I3X9G8_SINF2|nr:hypothetical protein [Sinorhizobium fredii]AFL52524.1 hypothetical protein USDA257_c39800 [Sinorhizobium fredii USDA 257]
MLKGRPGTIGIDGQIVVLVSLKALADILCGNGLEEFKHVVARVPKGRRRIVSNR